MVTDTTPKGPEPLRVMRGLVFILAALLLIGAIYYYFVPVHVNSNEGVFGCGSASNPPNQDKDGFQYGACQKSAVVNQFRTYALAGAAVVTALSAFLLFRTPRSDDWEDDIDLAEREAAGARRGTRQSGRETRETSRGGRDAGEGRDETSRGLRGSRGDEPATRERTDDWDDAVSEEPRSRNKARRVDSFLDDEVAEADEAPPRRSRRRRDDDF